MARTTTTSAGGSPHARGLSGPWAQSVIFLLTICVIVARRPDALFHAQFFAEDGRVWFANAYNLGWWHTLTMPQDGYFQTLPRITAALALLVPFSLAPLVMNAAAILLQAMPVCLLASPRSSAWGDDRFRLLLAALYIALPNCEEMVGTITNAQWLLALSAFLLLIAAPPRSAWGRFGEMLLFALCGLTGPFCIFLLPVACAFAWRRRSVWRWLRCALLGASCLVQAWALAYVGRAARPHAPLEASLPLLVKLLAGQIYLGALFGHNDLAARTSPLPFAAWSISAAGTYALLVAVALAGTALLAWCAAKAAPPMRWFLMLTAVLLVTSLLYPAVYPPPGVGVWRLLAAAGPMRYWFFPTLAVAWSVAWYARFASGLLRSVGLSLMLLMLVGICVDWHHAPLLDMHFPEYAKTFNEAAPQTTMLFPINPRGWNMQLIKH